MIILYTDAAHGYVLSNRVLGESGKHFTTTLSPGRRNAELRES